MQSEDNAVSAGNHATITEAVSKWRQGDVIEWKHFAYIGDARNPTTPQSAEIAAADPEASIVRLTVEVKGLVILSQTCDIVRSSEFRPFIEVCPLVVVSEQDAKAALHCESIRYAAVPWYDGENVAADLDQVMTIEKGMLVSLKRASGWITDDEIRRFQFSIVRKHQRFAFPNCFNEAMRKLRNKVISRHGKAESAEGRLFAKVQEVRVRAEPSWDAAQFEVEFSFVIPKEFLPKLPADLDPGPELLRVKKWLGDKERTSTELAIEIEKLIGPQGELGDPQALSELWQKICEAWVKLVDVPKSSFKGVTVRAASECDYSIAEYKSSEALDLDYLSQAEAS